MLKWFAENFLKANPGKYHNFVSNNEKKHLNVGETEISNSKCEKLLGIKTDCKLMFDSHVKSLCRRVAYQLNFNQRKLNYFITSQFSYTPLVWMFHSSKQNHHISCIHERASRIVYNDHNSSFDELLERYDSCKIHDRDLQKLVTEIFKLKMNLPPEIMKDVIEILECPDALRK